jgi:hypothetical protein
METWLELAVLHEAGHAWVMLTLAEQPVTGIIPPPGAGDDPRCEWNAGDVSPAAAVAATLGGLAAELLAGVPEDLAWRNAEEDLANLAALGMEEEIVERALDMAMKTLKEDRETFSVSYQRLRAVAGAGLPLRWREEPGAYLKQR